MAKKPKLGSGKRFQQLKGKLASKGATNPGALAAYIGRKKYGTAKFQSLAAKGKKGREPEKGETKAHEKGESKAFEKKEHGKKERKRRSPSNPFGTLKTDKGDRAGVKVQPTMLSHKSQDSRLNTGKTLLDQAKGTMKLRKAMARLAKH